MKIYELKEKQPLTITEATQHVSMPGFSSDKDTFEINRIKTQVFTDGELEKEMLVSEESIAESDEACYIGRKRYEHDVDTLKTKDLYFKNHSFVVTVLMAEEWTTIGNITGWFDRIKDVSVFLENKKDRKALRNAKQIICEIKDRISGCDYSSKDGVLVPQAATFKPEKVSGNVYSLKR